MPSKVVSVVLLCIALPLIFLIVLGLPVMIKVSSNSSPLIIAIMFLGRFILPIILVFWATRLWVGKEGISKQAIATILVCLVFYYANIFVEAKYFSRVQKMPQVIFITGLALFSVFYPMRKK